MNEEQSDDRELLRQYLAGSEAAFRELVNRHVGLVQATVRRVLNSAPHLADDVTQIVFTDLAKKASTLSPEVVLAGWLHRHSYYLALNTARAENRRRHRERTAMEINDVNEGSLPAKHWLQLAPVLDAALDHLDTTDRDAIVLRYLQQRNLRSVGQTIGLSEDAAQKRVARALDKLRDILVQRGVTVTGVMLATELEASAGPVAVSPSVAASISAHALSSAAVSTSLTLLSLKTMITSKLALSVAAVIVIVGATTAIIVHHNTDSPPPNLLAPLATVPSVKTTPPQIVAAPKVEAPKLAPAPAGNAPAGPNDLAAAAASRSGSSNSGQTQQLNGTGATAASTGARYGAILQQMNSVEGLKESLESFKKQSAAVIARATADANGDPDKLAKVETARQQYEQFAEDKQKQIGALEVQGVVDGTASTGVGKEVTAAQLQQVKARLETLQQQVGPAIQRAIVAANGDPDKLAQANANWQFYEKQVQDLQNQINAVEAHGVVDAPAQASP